MLLILPIIVIAGASVILLCYIMYMLRNKIPCYSYNKMKTGVAIKLKTIRSSNSNVSNKQSHDSESEWEDFCSSIEDKDKEDKDENKDNLSADRCSNTDSLTWDNETNIVGVSTEHIYDLVYEGPVPTNKEIEVELEPPQDVEKIESPEEKKPITEHVYMNFHPSNPFIDYKAIERSASNPFLLETTNNISANPFRRAYSEDNIDNKPEDDRIDASAVSLV
ncbi:IEV transmembrane phosphoprotein [NY_014 poxvirus]|uniref:IEV transmembrane phosphoprotein n=1 Tax=NY_014 poxvirus TaxID=2025360 RepID=UPI000B9A00C2|nr:IEV transmembrane phosphoprotein [NY_014 poxvirus]AST09550.1 IEV transmembrane phosphoprotein [NY_014 poxvirus]